MTPSNASALDAAMEEFTALSTADRRAILSQLTQAEQLTLKYALARHQKETAARAARKPDFTGCSPWLAAQLIAILDQRTQAQSATKAARAALCAAATNRVAPQKSPSASPGR